MFEACSVGTPGVKGTEKDVLKSPDHGRELDVSEQWSTGIARAKWNLLGFGECEVDGAMVGVEMRLIGRQIAGQRSHQFSLIILSLVNPSQVFELQEGRNLCFVL